MKKLMLGTLVGVGLLLAALLALDPRSQVFAQRAISNQPIAGSDLIVVPTALPDNKGQMLTVIDPRQQAMSVYHIDFTSGKIVLRSVRNFRWDLQMTYFNNETPLPQEIHSLLEQSAQGK
jgi:hypothetical protein